MKIGKGDLESAMKFFVRSSGVLLFITALAKIISAFGIQPILARTDPILIISYRNLFWSVGGIELVVAAFCLLQNRMLVNLGLIAWISSEVLVYRLGLWLIGWKLPCVCLGSMTGAIHIPQNVAALIMRCVLSYLAIGSFYILYRLWRQDERRSDSVPQNVHME